MDESVSSSVVAAPDFLSYVASILKILLAVGVPIGLFVWWKTSDDRRREQEKQDQQRFNLILTREKQRQQKGASNSRRS